MPTWRKKPVTPGTRAGQLCPRYVTLDPRQVRTVFIVWKAGSRQPRSYHLNQEDAQAEAAAVTAPGERHCILRAEIIGTVSAAAPVITFTEQ